MSHLATTEVKLGKRKTIECKTETKKRRDPQKKENRKRGENQIYPELPTISSEQSGVKPNMVEADDPLSARADPFSSRANPLSVRADPFSARANPLSALADPLSAPCSVENEGCMLENRHNFAVGGAWESSRTSRWRQEFRERSSTSFGTGTDFITVDIH